MTIRSSTNEFQGCTFNIPKLTAEIYFKGTRFDKTVRQLNLNCESWKQMDSVFKPAYHLLEQAFLSEFLMLCSLGESFKSNRETC